MDNMKKFTETRNTEPRSFIAQRIVGTLFGILEILLAFRLIFKGLGANPGNGFVNGIYYITNSIVGIFTGIFSQLRAEGAETTAIFEPATLIAMIVIALIAWAVLKLMTPHNGESVKQTESFIEDETKNSN